MKKAVADHWASFMPKESETIARLQRILLDGQLLVPTKSWWRYNGTFGSAARIGATGQVYQ